MIEAPKEQDYENYDDYSRARAKFWDDRRDIALQKVKEILEANNIKMNISGCGCCGSPTVSFIHNDQIICEDVENFKLYMIGEEVKN